MTVIAEVVRSEFVECRHHGSMVTLRPDGGTAAAIGDITAPMLPRSSNKPLQMVGMLRAGLRLPPPLVAVGTASHAGEPMHITRVQRLLTTAGLDPSALRCPAAQPGDAESALRRQCDALGPEPLYMNCSGKHAAMLATCVVNGWPTETYLDRDHPLQQAIGAAVADLAGEPVAAMAVDGCGAPIFAISLVGLARAFRAIAVAAEGTVEHEVAAACIAHPELLSGTHRPDGALTAAMPGLFAKAGAEGVFAGALADGRAFAVRTHDGASRSTHAVVAEILHAWGATSPVIAAARRCEVLGGGVPVGEIRPSGEVCAALSSPAR